jgi:hypothetical protein
MSIYKAIWEADILVGTTLVTFSSNQRDDIDRIFLTLRNSAITFSLFGNPTTNVGHNLDAGSNLTLYGPSEIGSFSCVGATTTTGSTGARFWATGSRWIG